MKINYCSMATLCFLALLIVTGCGKQQEVQQQPMKVKVMKVHPVSVANAQEYSGTIEESSGSTLSFPVAGTVRQIKVEAGQRVSKGELIAALDEATLQSSNDAAVATLEQTEDAWRRMKQLHDNGSLPEMQWVEVQSKLKQAQSVKRISEKNLADAKLYAPFSGIISMKSAEVGQNVAPGSPIVRLVTVSQVKVHIAVPENEISRVAIGQAVHVTVAALGERTFSGRIAEKGIVANALSRSYEVKALIDNPDEDLMPGMICTLSLNQEKETAAIVLPARIVQTDETNHSFVWINDRGKARKRIISTGWFGENGIQAVSGLENGDEIIVEGQQKVSENMDITAEK